MKLKHPLYYVGFFIKAIPIAAIVGAIGYSLYDAGALWFTLGFIGIIFSLLGLYVLGSGLSDNYRNR